MYKIKNVNGENLLICKRVVYGKKDVSPDKREYQLFNGSPVGTTEEIKSFIDGYIEEKIDGLLLCERDGTKNIKRFLKENVCERK